MPIFRLRPVEPDPYGGTSVGHLALRQCLDEPAFLNQFHFAPGDEWIGGVLYPTHLGISFAERLADVPAFVAGVESLTGVVIDLVSGTASLALPGDSPLIGDWIRSGTFDTTRYARTFDRVLGGTWRVVPRPHTPGHPRTGYYVDIRRLRGTSP